MLLTFTHQVWAFDTLFFVGKSFRRVGSRDFPKIRESLKAQRVVIEVLTYYPKWGPHIGSEIQNSVPYEIGVESLPTGPTYIVSFDTFFLSWIILVFSFFWLAHYQSIFCVYYFLRNTNHIDENDQGATTRQMLVVSIVGGKGKC